jgi:hypothetical protein
VQTVQEQAFAVKERVTTVEKVGEATRLRAAAIDDGLAKLDKKVLILERDRDIRIEAKRTFQESINEKAAKEAEAKKRMDDLQRCLQQTDLKVGDVFKQLRPQMMFTTAHVAPTRLSTRRSPSFKSSRENWQTTLPSLLNCRFTLEQLLRTETSGSLETTVIKDQNRSKKGQQSNTAKQHGNAATLLLSNEANRRQDR